MKTNKIIRFKNEIVLLDQCCPTFLYVRKILKGKMDRRVILKVEEVWYAKPKHRPRVLFVSKYLSNKFLEI
jgi:hypothetical protein